MNKNELTNAVADKTGMTKTDVNAVIEATLDAVTEALASGDEVRLIGFGTFLTADRAASQGRNPRTGAPLTIPAAKVPKFRAGKGLKDAVND